MEAAYDSLMTIQQDQAPSTDIPSTMHAVLLTGHGGFDRLEYRTDVAVPQPGPFDVLIRIGAAGVNNTDVNTRIGWYSKSITGGTDSGASSGFDSGVDDDGSWSGAGLSFPRIQGADAVGTIVAVGSDVDRGRIGERVMVRSMQTDYENDDPTICITYGSEFDGGFAQFTIADARESFVINSSMTDIELASFPCAYSTAEGMLHRVGLRAGERVLITGASGGVGSAAIQLAKRRGAEVVAVSARLKWDAVTALGADDVLGRNADLVAELGAESVDVVMDLVAGAGFAALLEVLKKQGRYVASGAIAGPIVDLDVRTLYLKDLTLVGSTFQDRVVFENLISYLEAGEIEPVVAKTFELADIVQAQQMFLAKEFVGKLVLVPPPVNSQGSEIQP